jgi:hypothetical protein
MVRKVEGKRKSGRGTRESNGEMIWSKYIACMDGNFIIKLLINVQLTYSNLKRRLGKMGHACNPSYSEAEIRRIKVQGQHSQNVSETPPQPKSWAWWLMSVSHPSYVGDANRRIMF